MAGWARVWAAGTPSRHQACGAAWYLENQCGVSWPGRQMPTLSSCKSILGQVPTHRHQETGTGVSPRNCSQQQSCPLARGWPNGACLYNENGGHTGRINYTYILSHAERQVVKEYGSCDCIYIKAVQLCLSKQGEGHTEVRVGGWSCLGRRTGGGTGGPKGKTVLISWSAVCLTHKV